MTKNKTLTLDDILEQHREWMRGIRTDRLVGTSNEKTKQAILQWVADEVILKPQGRNDKDIGAMSNTAKRTRGNRNELRREQIQTLVQHGYKGANQ